MKKSTIALVYGGYSSEMEISKQSGRNVSDHLDRNRYEVYEVLIAPQGWHVLIQGREPIAINKSDFSFELDGTLIRFDAAFLMIHGIPGENGQLQAYFDMIGLPYTGCSSLVSALTFSKYACKAYVRDTGVALAKDQMLYRDSTWTVEELVDKLGLPMFVKPNDGGSSFGITKVKSADQLEDAIRKAFQEGDTVLLESQIVGRELTEGVYFDGHKAVALPITEIVTEREYFDYEAKYLGLSKEICPAPIDEELRRLVEQTTLKIFAHLGNRGWMRIDYIYDGERLHLLEINPTPGMTEASLVPVQLRTAGISMETFTSQLLDQLL